MNKVIGLHEHQCAQCGTDFECGSQYAYKKRRKGSGDIIDYYCSYSCLREAEKEKEHVTKTKNY